jgi:hypothetical protein
VLLPRTWEKNSTPRLGAAPQDILDQQIVDSSAVVPGSFDAEQFAQVQKFKERAKSCGLYREYPGVDELVEHALRRES